MRCGRPDVVTLLDDFAAVGQKSCFRATLCDPKFDDEAMRVRFGGSVSYVSPRSPLPTIPDSKVEKQLAEFIDKFDPANAKLIRQCRVDLRKLMPTAVELVYDNYNFFVIGYCTTLRASDCIVSIAAAANGVGISFYHGATLADPDGLLQGSGKQNRFIRVPSIETLRSTKARALINAAIAQAKVPLPLKGAGSTVIQSVSGKQRPRRKAENTT